MARSRKKAKTGTRVKAKTGTRVKRKRNGLTNSAIITAVKSTSRSGVVSTPSGGSKLIANLPAKIKEPEARPVTSPSGNTGLTNSAITNVIQSSGNLTKVISNLASKVYEDEGRIVRR